MFDIKTFMNDIGLPDDDRQSVLSLFDKHPDAVAKIGTKLDSVISTQLSERLSTATAELDAKRRELDAQFETLDSVRGNDERAVKEAEKRIEKLTAQLAVAKTRVEKIATETGLDATEYLKDIEDPVQQPRSNVIDKPALDADQIVARANVGALAALENSALIQDLADEHLALFGTRLSRVELLSKYRDTLKRTNNQNLGLADFWKQEYKVDAKQSEIREADMRRRETEAEERGRQRAIDEMSLRTSETPRTTFEGSPLLNALKPADGQSRVHVAGVPEAVSAAVISFRKTQAERRTA